MNNPVATVPPKPCAPSGEPENDSRVRCQTLIVGDAEELLVEEVSIDGLCGVY